jgi:DNA-binding beta-propeller fold protein YncE
VLQCVTSVSYTKEVMPYFQRYRLLLISSISGIWLSVLIAIAAAHPTQTTPATQLYLPLLRQPSYPQPATPTWGAPILRAPQDGRVWVVNPDAGSVSSFDPRLPQDVREISIGGEPWSLAFTPSGDLLLVLDRASGDLLAVDPVQGQVQQRLHVGPEPGHVLVHPAGTHAYVSSTLRNLLLIVRLPDLQITTQIPTAPAPFALAVSAAGDRVYLTHFHAQAREAGSMAHDDGADGLISMFTAQGDLLTTIQIAPDAHGFANQLASISLHADRAWVPIIRAAPEQPNTLSTTVFAAVASLDLRHNRADPLAQLNLNDEEIFGSPVNNPVAAVPSPDGRTLYVVLAGSDLVEVVDVQVPDRPRLLGFIPAGRNPRGMTISPDGRYGYVMSYLSRAVTILDLSQQQVVGSIPVTRETLDAQVLRGKILFNTVTDPRMAKSSWVSCASCHADGGADNVTWMLADGPRQTPGIWNAGATLPWHWSAALDEAQDVEDSIHVLQFGLGLAPGADPALLGTPNAGRSRDLDALAAYLERGIRPPRGQASSSQSLRGRAIFSAQGCASCHGGPKWTISALTGPPGTLDPDGNGMIDAVLRDVGTATAQDVRGATGFDVPALIGVGLTAPYMHDGSLPTLAAVLDSGHPTPGVPRSMPLSASDKAALLAFLHTLDMTTPPVVVP